MDIYQLKITLQGIRKPTIWRRVRIPAIVPFETLHTVIQETMGWQGYHLYEFSDIRKEGDYNRSWRVTNLNDWGEDCDEEMQDTLSVKIDKYLKKPGDSIMYMYDFGDSWRHMVLLEDILVNCELGISCIGGKGMCPPEDVGGANGYEEMKRVLTEQPCSPEAKSYKEWLGCAANFQFDPTHFSRREANARLKAYFD